MTKRTPPTAKPPASGKSSGKPRGMAALSPEERKRIASLGGRAVQAAGTGNRFTSEAARKAGSKGGKSISSNRTHMAAIGAKGGRVAAVRRHEKGTP